MHAFFFFKYVYCIDSAILSCKWVDHILSSLLKVTERALSLQDPENGILSSTETFTLCSEMSDQL
jgi:hypothetical protein